MWINIALILLFYFGKIYFSSEIDLGLKTEPPAAEGRWGFRRPPTLRRF